MSSRGSSRSLAFILGLPLLLLALLPATAVPPAGEGGDESPGEMAFLALKCNLCHEVSSEGIERTSKSEKMRGRDMAGMGDDFDREAAAAYIRQEREIDGEKHKKPFKGSDEELQAILDWLGSLES